MDATDDQKSARNPLPPSSRPWWPDPIDASVMHWRLDRCWAIIHRDANGPPGTTHRSDRFSPRDRGLRSCETSGTLTAL